jgi:hypothetical protein
MTSRQRIEVLLILLGSPRRVTLPKADVRLVDAGREDCA